MPSSPGSARSPSRANPCADPMPRPASATRRATRLAIVWFVVSTVVLIAPVYTWLGNRIEPRVLGLPWSLVYVLGVIVLNTVVLAALYAARAVDAEEEEDPRG